MFAHLRLKEIEKTCIGTEWQSFRWGEREKEKKVMNKMSKGLMCQTIFHFIFIMRNNRNSICGWYEGFILPSMILSNVIF